MAKSKKSSKSGSARPSVKVRDMKAKKDPKGGFIWFESPTVTPVTNTPTTPTLNPATLNFKK